MRGLLHRLFGWAIDPPAGYYKCHVCGLIVPGFELAHNVFWWLHVCPAAGCGASVVPSTEAEYGEYGRRIIAAQERAEQEAERARQEADERERQRQEREEAEREAERERERVEHQARVAAALYFENLCTSFGLCAKVLPSDEGRGELCGLLAEVRDKVSLGVGTHDRLLKAVVAAVCWQFPEIWPAEASKLMKGWARPRHLQRLLDEVKIGWAVKVCPIPDCACGGLIVHYHCVVEMTEATLIVVHALRKLAREQGEGDEPGFPDGGMEGDGAALAGGTADAAPRATAQGPGD